MFYLESGQYDMANNIFDNLCQVAAATVNVPQRNIYVFTLVLKSKF